MTAYKQKEVAAFTLKNNHGMEVRITNFGARIVSMLVPDRDGRPTDVVLGFDRLEDYYPENHSSDFGAVIGRYANRIKNGRLTVDGMGYQLPQNNGPHCLHGGPDGWQYRVFDVVQASAQRLELALASPDGDNGFPGCVHASVTYTLQEDNTLQMDYRATADRTTVVNMTNHSYFNLNGDAATTVLNHRLAIDADRFLPIDETFVPQGIISPVEGTPMDFRSGKPVGEEMGGGDEQLRLGHGYDHCWLLNTRGSLEHPCARLESPATGIAMEVFTTAPGMQVYTGNFLDGMVQGKGGTAYRQHSAICLETQLYPDSPNHDWPESDAFLRPGEEYRSCTRIKFKI